MTPMVTKSPITMVMTKIEPMAMPVFDSGMTTLARTCQPLAPASRAASISDLSMRSMELRIGTIMKAVSRWTKAIVHRETGIEQPFDRLTDQSEPEQRLVDQPVAAEQRNPGDHPDHVGGPERNDAHQRQHQLHGERADMEGEKIGDGETEHQRHRPDDQAEFQGRKISAEGRAQLGQAADALVEHRQIVLRRKGRNDRVFVVAPEADDQRDQRAAVRRKRRRPSPSATPANTASNATAAFGFGRALAYARQTLPETVAAFAGVRTSSVMRR